MPRPGTGRERDDRAARPIGGQDVDGAGRQRGLPRDQRRVEGVGVGERSAVHDLGRRLGARYVDHDHALEPVLVTESHQIGGQPLDRDTLRLGARWVVARTQPPLDLLQLTGDRRQDPGGNDPASGEPLGPLQQRVRPQIVPTDHQVVQGGQPGGGDLRLLGDQPDPSGEPGPDCQRADRRRDTDRAARTDQPEPDPPVHRSAHLSASQRNRATPATISMPPSTWERNSGSVNDSEVWPMPV